MYQGIKLVLKSGKVKSLLDVRFQRNTLTRTRKNSPGWNRPGRLSKRLRRSERLRRCCSRAGLPMHALARFYNPHTSTTTEHTLCTSPVRTQEVAVCSERIHPEKSGKHNHMNTRTQGISNGGDGKPPSNARPEDVPFSLHESNHWEELWTSTRRGRRENPLCDELHGKRALALRRRRQRRIRGGRCAAAFHRLRAAGRAECCGEEE